MIRLTSRFVIDFLMRKAQQDGGFACVLAKGDPDSGGILIQCRDRDNVGALLERRLGFDDKINWVDVKPTAKFSESTLIDYVEKRKKSDPDLWVIELDIVNPEQFIATNGEFC